MCVYSKVCHLKTKIGIIRLIRRTLLKNGTEVIPAPFFDINSFVQKTKFQEDQFVFEAYRKAVKKELKRTNFSALSSKLFTEAALKEITETRRRPSNLVVAFQDEYQKLLKYILQIIALTKNEPQLDGYAVVNQQILLAMRHALQSPAYEFVKEQENEPIVHFLHALALASFTEPALFLGHEQIGNFLYPLTKKMLTHEKRDPHLQSSFARLLYEARQVAHKIGLIKEDISLRYFWNYFYLAWGTFLSMPFGRKLAHFFSTHKYDSRGSLGNNAGVIFEEIVQNTPEKTVHAKTIMTPTITIGDAIAFEAKAVLQALENRNYMSQTELRKDPYPYLCWIYTNLQNINASHEMHASLNIMQLEKEYPLSFSAITVTNDSHFYRAGVHGHNEKKIEQALADYSGLNEAYKEELKKDLLDEQNFTLCNRGKKGDGKNDPGYYFPWKKADCIKPFSHIVDHAFDLAVLMPAGNKKENWYQKAAFRELVNLGIIRYHQMKSVWLVCARDQRRHVKDVSVLFTSACKESIDRGAKVNAALLWAQLEATQENEKRIFSLFYGRSLLTRHRLILRTRHEAMYALISRLAQKDVHNFLQSIQG